MYPAHAKTHISRHFMTFHFRFSRTCRRYGSEPPQTTGISAKQTCRAVINPSVESGVECDGGPPTMPGGVVTDVVLVETARSIAESDQLIVARRSVSTSQSSIAERVEIMHQAATPYHLWISTRYNEFISVINYPTFKQNQHHDNL